MSELERLLRERMDFFGVSSVAQDYVLKAVEEARKEFEEINPRTDYLAKLLREILKEQRKEEEWLYSGARTILWFVRWFGAAAPAVHGHRSSGTEQSVEDTAPHER